MYLRPIPVAGPQVGFPRTRGDVPRARGDDPEGVLLSPHSWGCTAVVIAVYDDSVPTYPAFVGLCRRRKSPALSITVGLERKR